MSDRDTILNEVVAALTATDGIGSWQEAVEVVEGLRIPTPEKQLLTGRQLEVYDFIVSYRAEFGNSPTTREIAAHFGFTQTAARGFLVQLAIRGWLRQGRANSSRNYYPV